MPEDYEKLRDALIEKGMSPRVAKEKAAKITNANRKKAGKPPMKPHRKKR